MYLSRNILEEEAKTTTARTAAAYAAAPFHSIVGSIQSGFLIDVVVWY